MSNQNANKALTLDMPTEQGIGVLEQAIKKALEATGQNLKIFGIGHDEQGRPNVRYVTKGFTYFITGYPWNLKIGQTEDEKTTVTGRAIDMLAFFYLNLQGPPDAYTEFDKEAAQILSDLDALTLRKQFRLIAESIEPDSLKIILEEVS